MGVLANQLLEDEGYAKSQRRSVDHLHLHVFGLPFLSIVDKIKYRPSYIKSRTKGLSHFIALEQAIRILEAGKKVSVMPC
ncbi:hypothetical protein EMMF5_005499 [Cystobasidiomycetes sp. EMM_F5]